MSLNESTQRIVLWSQHVPFDGLSTLYTRHETLTIDIQSWQLASHSTGCGGSNHYSPPPQCSKMHRHPKIIIKF